jgi:Leucine-rich repeat (LRR) protein
MVQDSFEPSDAPTRPSVPHLGVCTLAELIAQARSGLPPDTIAGFTDRVAVIRRVAERLAEAHARGVCHNDLRPQRIQVTALGAVELDGWEGPADQSPAAAAYLAPERVAGAGADVLTDVYALGAIFWELLTLRPALVVEENLTRFWRRKRDGDVDPLPLDVKQLVPPELLAAARRAMAKERTDRWSDIAQFSVAAGLWLRRVESVAVTMQAESMLAERQGDEHGVSAASAGFHSALALWPDNAAARDGLQAAGVVQAISALGSGGAAAATGIAGAGPAQLAVTAEFSRLRSRQRRSWLLSAVAVLAIAVALAVAASSAWWLPRLRSSIWQGVAEWEPSPGRQLTGLVSTTTDVDAATQVPTPDATSFVPPQGRMVWLEGVDGRGDVRITIDATWQDRIDGLELMLGIPRQNLPSPSMTPPGYSCQFGGSDGAQTFISASPVAGSPQRPSPVSVPFKPGTRYALAIEKRGDLLRLLVDGREVYRLRSVIPIGDSRSRWLALRAWNAVRIHRILVEKPLHAPTSGPLASADALAESGHHADALAAFSELLRRLPPGRDSDLAMVKAHLMASLLPEHDGQRSRLFTRASSQLAASPLLFDVMQAEAVCRWRRQDWQGALSLAQTVQARHPEERCALALLEQRLTGIPEHVTVALLDLLKQSPQISHLDLSDLGLRSITALAGMQLSSLDLGGNNIEDLAPLSGMPLVHLDLTGNQVADISVLKGMPLSVLKLAGNRIGSVSALAGSRLRVLQLAGNRVVDLAPLAGLPLAELDLSGNPVADVAPLTGCAQLADLRLADTQVTSVPPLPQPLAMIDLSRCRITDVSALARSALVTIRLDGCPVEDLAALPFATLRNLYLRDSNFSRLAILKGATLAVLDLGGTQVRTLEDLRLISFTAQARLLLDGTPVEDIAPVAGLGIASIGLARTKVRDLTPFAGVTMSRLDVSGTPVADLAPVLSIIGLRDIVIWDVQVRPAELDAFVDQLERLHHPAPLINRLRAQVALRAKDWRRLRAMATTVGSRPRLILGLELPVAQSRALAREAGAHLPCPQDAEDLRALREMREMPAWFWLGLTADRSGRRPPVWDEDHVPSDPMRWMRRGPHSLQAAGYRMSGPGREAQLVPDDAPASTSAVVFEW